MVLVSHDRYFINAVATHVLEVLPGGQTTLFEGDYDAYLYRKSGGDPEVIAALLRGEMLAPPGQEREDKPLSDRAAAKARKRAEAERRNELSRRTKPIRQRLQALERDIDKGEQRLQEIQQLQLDPTLYEDGDRVRALSEEHGRLSAEVDAMMAKWEELSLRIEAIEAELNAED